MVGGRRESEGERSERGQQVMGGVREEEEEEEEALGHLLKGKRFRERWSARGVG